MAGSAWSADLEDFKALTVFIIFFYLACGLRKHCPPLQGRFTHITGQEHGVPALIETCQSDPSWGPLASVDETGAPERWEICVGERTHL